MQWRSWGQDDTAPLVPANARFVFSGREMRMDEILKGRLTILKEKVKADMTQLVFDFIVCSSNL